MAWQDYKGEMVGWSTFLVGASVAGVIMGTAGGVLTPLGGALFGGGFAVGAIAGYAVVELIDIDEEKYPVTAKVVQVAGVILGGCIGAGLTALAMGMTLFSATALVMSAQIILLAVPVSLGALLALILLVMLVGLVHTQAAVLLNLESAHRPV